MDPHRPAILPTLRQLQFLVALQTHGSFVRAADAIGVTQPTLSAGIKELEALLGATLVDRSRSGAVLTPAGEEAAFKAQRALGEVEELVFALRGAGKPLTGPFRLGAIPTIAPYVLPRAVPALRARYPHMRLYLREDLTARLIDGLRARTLDAALIALPYEAAGIDTVLIGEDEFLFAAPKDHPLAERDAVPLEGVAGESLLLLEDGHCLRDHALSVCAAAPGRRAAEVQATSLTTLVQMVAGGLGVTLLPRLCAEGGATAGAAVAVRPFENKVIGRSIGVAYRSGSARAEDARRLADAVRELI